MNKAGNLCLGRVCLTTEATETGLEFTLDPASCDPETREKLIGAMIKGAKLTCGTGRQGRLGRDGQAGNVVF